jgi:hypothetical protein
VYISFYVFNANFFEYIEVWDFEFLNFLKVYGASVPIYPKSLVESNDTTFMNFSKFWKCWEYIILQGAHDGRVQILLLAKHDLRVIDRWVPHVMGPACSEGKSETS